MTPNPEVAIQSIDISQNAKFMAVADSSGGCFIFKICEVVSSADLGFTGMAEVSSS